MRRTKLLLILSALLTSSCALKEPKDVKIYQASLEEAALVRYQEEEFISFGDPAIDNYMCLSKEDLIKVLRNLK